MFSPLLAMCLLGYATGLPARDMGPRAYSNSISDNYGEAGATLVDIPLNNGYGELLYTKVGGPTGQFWKHFVPFMSRPWKAEVGLVNVGAKNDGTTAKASTKFGTAGLEVGWYGFMGRASLTEGTFGVGPVDMNMGIGVDTGIILDRGVEAKLFGIGGKIGADGIQGCFVFCLGINW